MTSPPTTAPGPGAEEARRRLAHLLAAHAPTVGEGWVPEAPAAAEAAEIWQAQDRWPAEASGPGASEGPGDLRRRALDAAVTGWTAAYGHPAERQTGDVPGRRGVRWGVRTLTAVAATAVLLVLAGLVVLRATTTASVPLLVPQEATGPVETEVPAPTDGPPGTGSPGGEPGPVDSPGPSGAVVVVHVVGAVTTPGVLTLAEGARVADALTAAGGPLPSADLTGVNLARVLVDGEQVVVPLPGQAAAPVPQPPGAAPGGAAAVVDLNTADVAALDGLPGIGPVLAQRIVDHRERIGGFTSVEELAEVPGIGPALLDGVRDLVRA